MNAQQNPSGGRGGSPPASTRQGWTLLLGLTLLCACGGSNTPSASRGPTEARPLAQLPNAGTLLPPSSLALKISTGQRVYVPAYSHIYYGSGKQFLLAITLSVRNTSPTASIILRSIQYYDSKGNLVKAFSEGLVKLRPLETTEFFIPESDVSGGSGAAFLVDWVAEHADATEPVVEAVMISTRSQQGLAFVTTGRVIEEHGPGADDPASSSAPPMPTQPVPKQNP